MRFAFYCLFLNLSCAFFVEARDIDSVFNINIFDENGTNCFEKNLKEVLWIKFQSTFEPTKLFWLKIRRKYFSPYPIIVKTNSSKDYNLQTRPQSMDCHYVAASHLMTNTPTMTHSQDIDPLVIGDSVYQPISLCHGFSGLVSLSGSKDLVRIEWMGRQGGTHQVHLIQIPPLPSESVHQMEEFSQFRNAADRKLHQRSKRSLRTSWSHMPGPFLVELYLVVDSKMVRMYGENKYSKLLSRITEVLHQLNIAFMQFNIYFTVVQLEIWEEDQIKLTDENNILMELQIYKRKLIDRKHDCLHAILGENLGSAKRGQSEGGSMCAYSRCVGYTKDHVGLEERQIAHSVIHEIGHNFGLSHDTEGCQCFGCIMSTGVEFGILKFQWSQCSRKEISSLIKSGMVDCLKDESRANIGKFPASVLAPGKASKILGDVSTSMCGNGVVDEGEECDCGGSTLCSIAAKRCCDPDTCKLKLGAYCASGTCCDVPRCLIKSAGTVCRPVDKRSCDLPEYCDGTTEWCPSDVYKYDGVPCTTEVLAEASHCYHGQCHSRGSWCNTLYGDTGMEAHRVCYSLNNIGDYVKNCGLEVPEKEMLDRHPQFWTARACNDESARCGRLWCEHSNERIMRLSPEREVEELVEGRHCNGARFHLDWFLDDAGLVPNGSPCGRGKMCMKGVCVSSQYNGMADCYCNGHGVCNNLRHCHCDPGFAPPNCTVSGNGGSTDSGSPQTFYRQSRIIIAAVFITLVVILTIVAIVSLLYHFHTRRWPAWLAKIKWPDYHKPEFIIQSKEPNKFGRSDSHYIRCSFDQFEKSLSSPKSPKLLIPKDYPYLSIDKAPGNRSPVGKNIARKPPLLLPKTIVLESVTENKPIKFQNPKFMPPKPLSDKPSKNGDVAMGPPIVVDKPGNQSNMEQMKSRFNQSSNLTQAKPPLLISKPMKPVPKDETETNNISGKPPLLGLKPMKPVVGTKVETKTSDIRGKPPLLSVKPQKSPGPRILPEKASSDRCRPSNTQSPVNLPQVVIATKNTLASVHKNKTIATSAQASLHTSPPPIAPHPLSGNTEASKSQHKPKIGKLNISQPRLEETTCNALTREISSPDQTLSRFVGPHKIIKIDSNTAIKYLY